MTRRALTAWQVGATVVTSNLAEFRRIQARLPGLSVLPPIHGLIG